MFNIWSDGWTILHIWTATETSAFWRKSFVDCSVLVISLQLPNMAIFKNQPSSKFFLHELGCSMHLSERHLLVWIESTWNVLENLNKIKYDASISFKDKMVELNVLVMPNWFLTVMTQTVDWINEVTSNAKLPLS